MMTIRLRYIKKCIQEWVALYLFRRASSPIRDFDKTMLIVKVDAIGDYILFRNFLKDIRNSQQYKDFRIIFCGNQIYREFAEEFDSGVVDEFIWLDRKKYIADRLYRRQFLHKISSYKYHTVINPNYSREFLVDNLIVGYTRAKNKITQVSNYSNEYRALITISDRWYSQLIKIDADLTFEFYRNKKFVELLLATKVDTKLLLPLPYMEPKEKTIVIFPGAGEKQKQWPPDKFVQLINELDKSEDYSFLICGSALEHNLGEYICDKSNKRIQVSNLCGLTTISELAKKIKQCGLLISNDSSAVHIAASVSTPTICIGNGRHYGRFTPYPKGMASGMYFIFPPQVTQLAVQDVSKLKRSTINRSIASIDNVAVEDVLNLCNKILQPEQS